MYNIKWVEIICLNVEVKFLNVDVRSLSVEVRSLSVEVRFPIEKVDYLNMGGMIPGEVYDLKSGKIHAKCSNFDNEEGCNSTSNCFWGPSRLPWKSNVCLTKERTKYHFPKTRWNTGRIDRKRWIDKKRDMVDKNSDTVDKNSDMVDKNSDTVDIQYNLSNFPLNGIEDTNKNNLGLDDFRSILFWLVIHIIYRKLGGTFDWDKRGVISDFKKLVLSEYRKFEDIGKYTVVENNVGYNYHDIYILNRILFIVFNAGGPFIEEDIKFSQIKYTEYDKLVVCGHSMGAGLSYLFTTKIIEDTESLLSKSFDFSNLYVYTTGLGRVPSTLADKFKQLHKSNKFNYIDLITIIRDGDEYFMDDRLDGITITTQRCRAHNYTHYDLKSPFYCKNLTRDCKTIRNLSDGDCKPSGKEPCNGGKTKRDRLRELDDAVENGIISPEEKSMYSDCVEDDWGPLYEETWNKCQGLYDKFHKHNEVNTFTLNIETGLIEAINKNELLKTKNIQRTTCYEYVNDRGEKRRKLKYHQFKYIYSNL